MNRQDSPQNLYPNLENYWGNRLKEFDSIPYKRQTRLDEIAAYAKEKHNQSQKALLTFICTHNSRRSHMAQIWAQLAARHYQLDHIETFSGGTEATAFNPRAVDAMRRAGFKVEDQPGPNPRYLVSAGPDMQAMECFSKKFDEPTNPSKDFAAIMVCSDADEACPFVPGATFRMSIPYQDPKNHDDTAAEATQYDERCRQIAREMGYLFSKVSL